MNVDQHNPARISDRHSRRAALTVRAGGQKVVVKNLLARLSKRCRVTSCRWWSLSVLQIRANRYPSGQKLRESLVIQFP